MYYIFTFIVWLCFASISISQTNLTQALSSSRIQANQRTPEERIKFLSNVAQAYFKDGDYESATSAYERILKIDPKHEDTRYVISHVYISAKRYNDAEELLLQLIKEFPDNFQLLNNLAWLYATAEDPSIRDGKKAIEIAQKAMVLAPTDHHVWSTLSEAYYISGEYEKAYRSITHMASIATRYGKGITKESVDSYNEQILKCKRAMETAASMNKSE